MNVDPAELQKFSDLAHRWWDPAGSFRPLHEINPLRLDWIDRLATLGGKRVVDVGCGGGILSESMSARGAEVLGIDLADKPLKVAQLHALETGARVEYRAVSAEELAREHAAGYDVVTCMEMLEHVPQPESTVAACAALARPGGWVFFSTINRNAWSFLMAIVGAEYVLRLLPRGTHEYARFIRPSELGRAARNAGLDINQVLGMSYQPLTRSYRLGPQTGVNYLMACRKESMSAGASVRPARTRLVLFDLDGTLVDTALDLAAAVNLCRTRRGLAPTPPLELRPWTSHGARGLIGRAFGLEPADAGYDELRAEFLEHYGQALCVHSHLYEGIEQTLTALEASSRRWGVVTNKPARFSGPLLRALGLKQRASCVVSGDTAARPKPDPAPILHALAECAVPPQECVYVGDDPRDIEAGRAAGVRTVAAAYGYLGGAQDVAAWGADFVILAPLDLLDWLET